MQKAAVKGTWHSPSLSWKSIWSSPGVMETAEYNFFWVARLLYMQNIKRLDDINTLCNSIRDHKGLSFSGSTSITIPSWHLGSVGDAQASYKCLQSNWNASDKLLWTCIVLVTNRIESSDWLTTCLYTSTTAKATGLIFSLLDITSAQTVPFAVHTMHHGLTYVLLCVLFFFSLPMQGVNSW